MIGPMAISARRRILEQHGHDDAAGQQHDGHQIHEADADKAFGLGDVAGGAAHQIAGLGPIMEGEGEILYGIIEVIAQVVGCAMGQPVAIVALAECGNAAHHSDGKDEQRCPQNSGHVLRRQALVNGILDDLGHKKT